MYKKGISHETLQTDSVVNNWPIFAPNVPKDATWTGLRNYVWLCIKINGYKERWTIKNQVTSVCSVMKYFGFIILTRSVAKYKYKLLLSYYKVFQNITTWDNFVAYFGKFAAPICISKKSNFNEQIRALLRDKIFYLVC